MTLTQSLLIVVSLLLAGAMWRLWLQAMRAKLSKKLRDDVDELRDAWVDRQRKIITDLRGENGRLQAQLSQASKNDHRDAKGRYAKAGS